MTVGPVVIWGVAAALYALFFLWYHGLPGRISAEEVQRFIDRMSEREMTPAERERLDGIRRFFEEDDGRDFVMVNLLSYNKPVREHVNTLSSCCWQMRKLYALTLPNPGWLGCQRRPVPFGGLRWVAVFRGRLRCPHKPYTPNPFYRGGFQI